MGQSAGDSQSQLQRAQNAYQGSVATTVQVTREGAAWLAKHYWLVDGARGALSFLIGAWALVELRAVRSLPWVLLAAVGVYLIVDGALDLGGSWLARGERGVEGSRLLSGALSLGIGVGALVSSQATLLLIVAAFGLRLIVRGAQDVWRAVSTTQRRLRQTVGQGERFLWFSGLWQLALGLMVVLLAPLLVALSVIYFGVYLVIDGVFGLAQAVAKARRPTYVWDSIPAPADATVPVMDSAHPSARRAVVFVRRSGANGLGHVGWAFEATNGWFNVGSVENPAGVPFAKPGKMGFWTAQTLDVVGAMVALDPPYDEFKVLFAPEPNFAAAWRTVVWISRTTYAVKGRNCADSVYDTLRAFGAQNLRDTAQKALPNEWYDALPGVSYRIVDFPELPLRPEAQRMWGRAPRIIALTPPAPAALSVSPPAWRTGGGRARYELMERLEYINEETLSLLRFLAGTARDLARTARARMHSTTRRGHAV